MALIVDPQREPDLTLEYIKELQIKKIQIRIKMWELDSLDSTIEFVKKCPAEVVFTLMQDREIVESSDLRLKLFETLFSKLSPYSSEFIIGTTINRTKWGFFSVDEYLKFYKSASQLRDKKYKNLKLIGGGVIDFEFHYFAHLLLSNIKLDAVSTLLYVDRRGAPENLQYGFDLVSKINLLSSMVFLKKRVPIYITETNYPLSNCAPYAPTSEKECVDEHLYSCYMVRYFLLSLATKQIKTVFWHQLIASGYGLVDIRDGVRKRESFYALKTVIKMLDRSEFITLIHKRDLYEMLLQRDDEIVRIFWSSNSSTIRYFSTKIEFIDMCGNSFLSDQIEISNAPIYLIESTS